MMMTGVGGIISVRKGNDNRLFTDIGEPVFKSVGRKFLAKPRAVENCLRIMVDISGAIDASVLGIAPAPSVRLSPRGWRTCRGAMP